MSNITNNNNDKTPDSCLLLLQGDVGFPGEAGEPGPKGKKVSPLL